MFDQIIASALGSWEELWPDRPPPKDIRCVLQTRRRVILFLFDAVIQVAAQECQCHP